MKRDHIARGFSDGLDAFGFFFAGID